MGVFAKTFLRKLPPQADSPAGNVTTIYLFKNHFPHPQALNAIVQQTALLQIVTEQVIYAKSRIASALAYSVFSHGSAVLVVP